MAKRVKIEYRNKYVDGKRHYHFIFSDNEVRLCDELISFTCTLPKFRHESGKECKKCQRKLDELLQAGVVQKVGGNYEVLSQK